MCGRIVVPWFLFVLSSNVRRFLFFFFFSTIYKINWLYISVACVIKCDQSVLRSVRKCSNVSVCVCVCACAGAQGFVGLYEGAV